MFVVIFVSYIKGNYRNSIYEGENGFVIGLFRVKETDSEDLKAYVNKTITFKGVFDSLNRNEMYYFYGEGVNHPKYGFQFDVTEYERIKPEGKDGIIQFKTCRRFQAQ